MPNFLIIGAGKSGTTSLYHYLGQHPQVYVSPVKEPKFFALEGEKPDFRGPGDDQEMMNRVANNRAVTSIKEYQDLFRGVRGEKAVGEASPIYLYSPEAPDRIKRHVPQAKLIAVLRDPAERAYSAFLHQVRNGWEPLTHFSEALRDEERRMQDNWHHLFHYKHRGFYHAQLSRYYERFGPEQIRVYLYEDLKADAAGVMRDLYGFLGVDEGFAPDTSLKYNRAGVPRNGAARALVRNLNSLTPFLKGALPFGVRQRIKGGLFAEPPPLAAEVRRGLIEEYREDVLRLQGLIGRDLSGWLEVGG